MPNQSGAGKGSNSRQSPVRRTKRPTRKELEPAAKAKILSAAAVVVGQMGYNGASMKRIAAAAGVAEGSLYLYFDSRQNLMDELLPFVGKKMQEYIKRKIASSSDIYEMEDRGIRAFFDFVSENEGFFRILNEAETASPIAHEEHYKILGESYKKSLKRGINDGTIKHFSEDELEAISYILMAARSYLHLRYFRNKSDEEFSLEKIISIYNKILRYGLT